MNRETVYPSYSVTKGTVKEVLLTEFFIGKVGNLNCIGVMV